MSNVSIAGDVSGTVTLQAPSAAGSTVINLPATTGNMVVDNATQTLTNKTYTNPTFSGTASGTVLVSGTAVASTSGTNIDFTGIPSWVKRITVMLNGVSTTGSSDFRFQIGNGSVVTTGYAAYYQYFTGSTLNNSGTVTNGFPAATSTSSDSKNGSVVLTNFSGNTWIATGMINNSASQASLPMGAITLSGTLDRIRITTVNGTDTFDAGSINILYE